MIGKQFFRDEILLRMRKLPVDSRTRSETHDDPGIGIAGENVFGHLVQRDETGVSRSLVVPNHGPAIPPQSRRFDEVDAHAVFIEQRPVVLEGLTPERRIAGQGVRTAVDEHSRLALVVLQHDIGRRRVRRLGSSR